jgi:uncharacterized protein (TIRG00374 family)
MKDVKRWLPGTLISLIAIGLLIRAVDWKIAADAIKALDWRYAAFFTIFYFLSTGSRAMTSRILLANKPTWLDSFLAMNQGYLLNNVLPLRLGELGRAFLLGRKIGLSTFHVLSTVLLERAYDLAFAAMMLIGSLPFVIGDKVPWAKPAAYWTLSLVAVGLLSLHLMARFRIPLRDWADRVFGRIAFLQKHILPQMDAFLDGLEALTSIGRFAQVTFWMSMVWFFGTINYYVLLLGFVPHAPLYGSIFNMGAASLGIAIPSAPAAVGVFEGAMVAALSVIGISSGTAVAYALTLHILHIIYSGIIGLIGFAREGQSLTGFYEQLSNRNEAP